MPVDLFRTETSRKHKTKKQISKHNRKIEKHNLRSKKHTQLQITKCLFLFAVVSLDFSVGFVVAYFYLWLCFFICCRDMQNTVVVASLTDRLVFECVRCHE